MEILKTAKTGMQDTLVLIRIPDRFLDDLAAFLHGLKMVAGEADIPAEDDELWGKSPAPAEDFDKVVELIRSTAKLGEPMTAGKKRRLVEVLGKGRAESLFGPNYGAASWDLFGTADPLKLARTPEGGYKQIANEKHNPTFLARLLKEPGESLDELGPVARTPKSQPGVTADPDDSPAEIWDKVVELSRSGRDMTAGQIGMLNKILGNSVYYMHPGNKNGAIDFFMATYTPRRKKEDGTWEDNPHYRKDAREYAENRIRNNGLA